MLAKQKRELIGQRTKDEKLGNRNKELAFELFHLKQGQVI
jgi:hypothetical protein